MAHVRRNGQQCPGRPFQEPTTMTIKCAMCREPIGPPPSASKKPTTIAASSENVNALLRKRLHPEENASDNPYAEGKTGSSALALDLIREKAKNKKHDEAVREHAKATAERMKAEAAANEVAKAAATIANIPVPPIPPAPEPIADFPEEAPEMLAEESAAEIVTAPTDDTPPLMAALQQAAREGDAHKAAESAPTARRRR